MSLIQIPTYNHIDQILALNSKYLINHLSYSEKQNGFIRIKYDKEDLEKIITHKEIVIALDNDKIIGYYLIGRKSENIKLNYQLKKVREIFKHSHLIEKAGYGAQAIIESKYRGQNLLNLMLYELIELLENKYNILFSSVTKINDNALKAHSKSGYKVLDEDESKYYIGLNINES